VITHSYFTASNDYLQIVFSVGITTVFLSWLV